MWNQCMVGRKQASNELTVSVIPACFLLLCEGATVLAQESQRVCPHKEPGRQRVPVALLAR